MEEVEHILWKGKTLAYIVRAELDPKATKFLTPKELNLQLGYVVYPGKSEISRHYHLPLKREIVGTSEVLIVKKGRCRTDIYNDDREIVATRELRAGDILLMVRGGHGFSMLEDTVFIEIKQGPYTGLNEKERF